MKKYLSKVFWRLLAALWIGMFSVFALIYLFLFVAVAIIWAPVFVFTGKDMWDADFHIYDFWSYVLSRIDDHI